jgi:hypothetical protein
MRVRVVVLAGDGPRAATAEIGVFHQHVQGADAFLLAGRFFISSEISVDGRKPEH